MSRREDLKRQLQERKRARDRARRRKRLSAALLALLLVLLLLLSRCACIEEPVPEPGPATPAASLELPEPQPPAAPLPKRERIQPIQRPAYESQPVDALPWLAAFRLQVAARSPRLSECFVGAERPGRLRWTAAVDPVRGQVSEQQLVPVSAWDTLTAEQSECVQGVLAEPAYRLQPGDGPTTPSRVSMVVEF